MKRPKSRSQSGRTVTTYYVASTHWDREWYEPFQHYRFRLVDVIDTAINVLESDSEYRHYMLDGQSCVLEDYLEVRPENRHRLKALFDAGRLEAGPWYVMPDEFLPCGESLVRNLVRGHRIAAEFGPPMRCGFVCDCFGHISQLPQILRGFGMDTAVVWRGTNYPEQPGVFTWEGADGSEVLAYTFEDRGYGNYFFDVRMPTTHPTDGLDLDAALAGLRKLIEVEVGRTPGNAVLAFDGLDHTYAEPDTPKLLATANEQGLRVVHATLGEFFAAIRKQKLRLKRCRGELRFPGTTDGHVIPGVLSSRMHLKQANANCEQRLLAWVEPFGVLAEALGDEYPAAYLDLAWKYLLLNHPHDSICGCSIDQVHRDMVYRFDQCRLIADRAGHMALRTVANHTPIPQLDGDEDYAITVFNPGDDAVDEVVQIPCDFNRETKFRFQEWFGYEPIIGFRLFDPAGKEVPYQRLDVTKLYPVKTFDRTTRYEGEKKERVNVAVRLKIPPRGWTTLVCKPTMDRTRSAGTQLVDDHTMDNGLVRVQFNPNGTFDLTDLRTGHTYPNQLTIEERADIGDGWYHGTAVNDEWFTSHGSAADISLIHDGFNQTTFRLRVVLNVPEAFVRSNRIMERSAELVPLVVTSWVTMRAGSPRLDIETQVENTARDHRVRALFPTNLNVKTYWADSAYDVVKRDVALAPDAHKQFEPEVETKPQYTFTAVNNGKVGLAVLASGQPESAVRDLPSRPIALTLFRGFARTVANEGEDGGQMLGTTRHRYALLPHKGPLPTASLCRLGLRLAAGIECIHTSAWRRKHFPPKALLPATGSWIKPGTGPLVITACKRSEDGKTLVLRAFNPLETEAQQRIELAVQIRAVHQADMLEQPVKKVASRGRAFTITAPAKGIVTLRIELGSLKSR